MLKISYREDSEEKLHEMIQSGPFKLQLYEMKNVYYPEKYSDETMLPSKLVKQECPFAM